MSQTLTVVDAVSEVRTPARALGRAADPGTAVDTDILGSRAGWALAA